MRIHLFAKLLVAAFVAWGVASPMAAQQVNIIPRPQQLTVGEGEFLFAQHTKVAAKGEGAEEVCHFFAEKVRTATGLPLKQGRAGRQHTVTFRIDPSVSGAEAYRLVVKEDQIEASAATSHGLFYAAQTLLQLLPPQVELGSVASQATRWAVPCVEVFDYPRFAYRGVMLDPCRHFLPVEAVKRQIETLSAYKINRLHWHLTDDQGWRIEIKKYPELMVRGASRVEGDGSIHSGYYTQDEVREVVDFARKHHMEVVPELEMPGHGLAAIAAFPWLSCRGDSITPRIIWGVEDIVFCPGRESTFRFLQDVIDEMTPLFPGTLFHIGGDESPREEWQRCDSCQARMKQLSYTREAQLQSYLIGRIEKYLQAKGKQIIGWDEILEGGNLDTTAVVMSWRGEEGGIQAARAGHPVLMTPASHGFYFDRYQSDEVNEPASIGGMSLLQTVYAYDPVPEALRGTGSEHYVMGIQANCWSEYLHTPELLEYRLYPRALALAEVGWTLPEHKDEADFLRRVDADAALRLQAHGVNFHIPMPEIANGSVNRLAFVDTLTVAFTPTPRPLPVVFTTDGTEPMPSSPRYAAPLRFTESATLRAATLLPCGLMSPVRTIDIRRQPLAPACADTTAFKPGLTMSIFRGTYLSPSALPAQPDEVKEVAGIEDLRRQTQVPASVRDVAHYAATVEGWMRLPADGVYEFATHNCQLWIDGQLAIDNSAVPVPRYSPNNVQLALQGGYHRVKVLFLGGIFKGWPTYWDNAAVRFRPAGGSWQRVAPHMLSH